MEKIVSDEKIKTKTCIPIRYVQVFMLFLSMVLAFSVRVVMSIAVVAMTNKNAENSFNWSIQKQSFILSAFNWGYIVLQGFSGELASKFGGMTLVTICIGVNSVISLLLPFLAMYGDWITVCICRVLQGVAQGVMYPSMHYLLSKWVPLDEKSRMASFVFAGGQFGTAFQLIISGYIANYWGWPAIFYVNGAFGIVWTVVYVIIGSDSPQVSKMISADERLHIQSSLDQIGGHQRLKTPWKSIFTSLPFIATMATNIGVNWGQVTLLNEIPTYMSNVLGVNIKSNGAISALPYITMFFLNFPVGFISDYTIKKKWLSVTACRNSLILLVSNFGPAITLICLSYAPAGNVALAVLLLVASIGLKAGCYSGFLMSYLDFAPNFASTTIAVSNFVSNSIAMFAPLTVGFILKDETNPSDWRVVFYITALVYIFTNLFYIVFGSSKLQKWNSGKKEISTA